MWGLDDLLNDVGNAEGQFGDVGVDIRLVFQAGVNKLQEYHDFCRENIIYYVSHALDPRIKLVNIREQCGEQADEIIDEIRQWLKQEYPYLAPIQQEPDEAKCPIGISQNQWKLLKRALPPRPLKPVSDIDSYLDLPLIQ
jgi:hypothetical protein